MPTESYPLSTDEMVRELWDRRQIEDLLLRYCRAFDRGDLEAAKDTYWPDALDDHPNFIGPAWGMCEDADRIHKQVFVSHQHYITNNLIELDGDTAHTETYFMIAARFKDSYKCMFGGGRYMRRVERRDGVWRIGDTICTFEWAVDEETAAANIPPSAPYSRDRDDSSYQRPLRIERELVGRRASPIKGAD